MRSGELARLTGVSTDTLRHYERMGLLARPHRTTGGYRAYEPQALDRVRVVRRALSIGFSLRELADIVKIRDGGGAPCRRVRELAGAKLMQLEQRLADLLVVRKHLRRVLRDWDQRLARTPHGARARLLETLEGEMTRGATFLGIRTPHTKKPRRRKDENHLGHSNPGTRFERRRTAGKND
jgi:DNA-binding transcriptional MerR regulator